MAQLIKRLYPNISTRIITPFLLVVILIAGLGVFITTRLVAGSLQERFNNQLADSAVAASNGFVEIENENAATLRLMAYTQGVADALVQSNVPALDARLQPLTLNAKVDQVIVFNADGGGVLELSGASTPTLVQNSEAFRTTVYACLMAQQHAEFDSISCIVGLAPDAMLYSGISLVDTSGKSVGSIAVGLTMRSVLNRISQQSLSGIIVYGMDGKVLATTFNAQPNSLARSADWINQVLHSAESISPFEDLSVNSLSYQALLVPLKLNNSQAGLMAIALPSNFVVQQSVTSRNIFAALFSGLFISVIFVGLSVARTITLPVTRLVNASRAIRKGDFSRRAQLSMPDELGELGTSFDAMTEELIRRNTAISRLYEDQIKETARREAVLSSISDALIVLDTDGKITMRNAKAAGLMTSAAHDKEMSRTLKQMLQSPESLFEPTLVMLADQMYRVTATVVCRNDGSLLGHVLVLTDITALIETERLKDDLIKQISHELRTPLTAIRGYVELVNNLERDSLSAQGKGFISSSITSIATLEQMISEVVDVSTIVSNQFRLNLARIDLIELVAQRIKFWQDFAAQRQLTLDALLPKEPVYADVDPKRLAQVIDHVIRNACNYTLPGGLVRAMLTPGYPSITIEITDTGVGISADEIDRVFDRMYRGQAAEAGPTDTRGLGLGLFLSKCIMGAHGGTIRLESQLHQGTTVLLSIPGAYHADSE